MTPFLQFSPRRDLRARAYAAWAARGANAGATDNRALAAEMGMSAAALAIAWLLHKAPHILPIPGTRSVDHFREHCDGAAKALSSDDMDSIEAALPIGWAHGDRYTDAQWVGPERYC